MIIFFFSWNLLIWHPRKFLRAWIGQKFYRKQIWHLAPQSCFKHWWIRNYLSLNNTILNGNVIQHRHALKLMKIWKKIYTIDHIILLSTMENYVLYVQAIPNGKCNLTYSKDKCEGNLQPNLESLPISSTLSRSVWMHPFFNSRESNMIHDLQDVYYILANKLLGTYEYSKDS